jgi:hypothetical protein
VAAGSVAVAGDVARWAPAVAGALTKREARSESPDAGVGVNSSPPAGVRGGVATVTGVAVPESVMPSDTVIAPAREGVAAGAVLAAPVVASVVEAGVAEAGVAEASGSPRGAGRVCAVHAVPSQ